MFLFQQTMHEIVRDINCIWMYVIAVIMLPLRKDLEGLSNHGILQFRYL